jgi:hypothetical protein
MHIPFSILGAVIGGVGTAAVLLGLGAYFDAQAKKSPPLNPEMRGVFDRMITGKENPTSEEIEEAKRQARRVSAKPETYEEKVRRVGRLSATAVPALATIMETSPLVIFPTSRLPLPKDEMKIALKLAWMTYRDDRYQNFIMQAYIHLAHFRDEVTVPIDPRLPKAPDNTPARAIEILEPYLAVANKVTTEMEALSVEFDQFTKQEAER